MWRQLAEELLPESDRPGYQLPLADLAWRDWCARFFPSLKDFAPRHIDAWDWFESLVPDVKPEPLILIFGRGGGKSSTIELNTGRLCATLKRRFMLYVSQTQQQADGHVQSIEDLLSQIGAQPKKNRAGRTAAWRREQLRTENGFNIAAYGLDTGARGIKIDQFRPDVIVLDDIDDLHDSLEQITKKIEIITRTILPAGSPDCAVIVVGNLVTRKSIMSQLSDDRAQFLVNRKVPRIEPAVYDLVTEAIPQGPGLPSRHRVVSGRATWVGQDLNTCQAQINEFGLANFLTESQHEVKEGGELAFPMFQGLNFHGPGKHGRHIVAPFDVPKHWTLFAGKDWGYNAPFAFILFGVDERGVVTALSEIVERHVEDGNQANKEHSLLTLNGSPEAMVLADPAMWASTNAADGVGPPRVNKFWAKGLNYVQANNDRLDGWANLREYLSADHMLRIVGENCPVLCAQIAKAIHPAKGSEKKQEDVDDDADIPPSHMDALSGCRYGLMQYPIDVAAPEEQESRVFYRGRECIPLREMPDALRSDDNDNEHAYSGEGDW